MNLLLSRTFPAHLRGDGVLKEGSEGNTGDTAGRTGVGRVVPGPSAEGAGWAVWKSCVTPLTRGAGHRPMHGDRQ